MLFRSAEQPVRFEVTRYDDKAYRPVSEKQSTDHVERLKDGTFKVAKREDKPTRSRPSAPFITSTLQQAASNRMGFSVKKR